MGMYRPLEKIFIKLYPCHIRREIHIFRLFKTQLMQELLTIINMNAQRKEKESGSVQCVPECKNEIEKCQAILWWVLAAFP